MKPTLRRAGTTALPLFCAFASVLAQNSGLNALVYKGCFSSAGDLSDLGSYTYQSPGYCQQQCVNAKKPVMGTTQGSHCYCGDLLPSSGDKVSDSDCNSKCNGYDQDMCGGSSTWSVQLTGLNNNVGSVQGSGSTFKSGSAQQDNSGSSSASSSATPANNAAPSVVTHASTIVVTAPGQTQATTTVVTTTENASPQNKTNVAGIAAGVVVGIVALSAIAGGIFFFLRNRKKRAVEEEYRRNVAAGYHGKPPSSSAGSLNDSRLEPSVMMQRRQSDGSIADNQDYSRRILKVTNPDGT